MFFCGDTTDLAVILTDLSVMTVQSDSDCDPDFSSTYYVLAVILTVLVDILTNLAMILTVLTVILIILAVMLPVRTLF